MPSAQRILVRSVNWLGDAVMATPALMRLREARSEDHITLVTPAKLKDLWLDHPAVNEVIAFENGEGALAVARRMSAGKFDIGIAFPNSHRTALELLLARIPQRIGAARPWRNWMLTKSIAARPEAVEMHKRSVTEINQLIQQAKPPEKLPATAHHIHQYLNLVGALGAKIEPVTPQLNVSSARVKEFVSRFKLDQFPESTKWIGLNAGAEYGPAKRWPEDRFIAAATEIQRRADCRWLVFGLKSDRDTCERITSAINAAATQPQPRAINLAGATTLGELCAALKFCRALLTNDSGPMHVAAALGTPVVALFGSTSPELTGPGLPGDARHQLLRAEAPCAPCFLRECPIDFRCMKNLNVERVVNAVLKVI